MAKSKNHTNHNQNSKAHRNGIKKPRQHRYPSLKGGRQVPSQPALCQEGHSQGSCCQEEGISSYYSINKCLMAKYGR
ncbi:predicted protein [Lichtheimia corymbifera JMRC:FSU:9682]|uniref:60S ribosomal protein L29 n=1 Tax=Lichtheimia corymbifera JMRC:FSU:9682 TaxID=1263082 RepID=A0A068RXI2_9FUNG|nr:predicted protein [Lichtheimia corymbifera JMRC:FSU:9682]